MDKDASSGSFDSASAFALAEVDTKRVLSTDSSSPTLASSLLICVLFTVSREGIIL
jgi:hypothetical protein